MKAFTGLMMVLSAVAALAAFGLAPIAAKAQFVSNMAGQMASGVAKGVGGELASWGMAQLGFIHSGR